MPSKRRSTRLKRSLPRDTTPATHHGPSVHVLHHAFARLRGRCGDVRPPFCRRPKSSPITGRRTDVIDTRLARARRRTPYAVPAIALALVVLASAPTPAPAGTYTVRGTCAWSPW